MPYCGFRGFRNIAKCLGGRAQLQPQYLIHMDPSGDNSTVQAL